MIFQIEPTHMVAIYLSGEIFGAQVIFFWPS